MANYPASNHALYYVQDPRSHVGNSMLWWKHDNCGYTCDIRNARVFTESEIKEMHSIISGDKKAFRKEIIDGRIQHHIDKQSCREAEAYQVATKKAVR